MWNNMILWWFCRFCGVAFDFWDFGVGGVDRGVSGVGVSFFRDLFFVL